jgi:hypothetical protein
MAVMLSDTTVTIPAIENATTSARIAQENSLPLNTFLDLNAANSIRLTQATPQRPDTIPDELVMPNSGVVIEQASYKPVENAELLTSAEQEPGSPSPIMQAGVSIPIVDWAHRLKPIAFLAVPLLFGYSQMLRRKLERSAGQETTEQIVITRRDPR